MRSSRFNDYLTTRVGRLGSSRPTPDGQYEAGNEGRRRRGEDTMFTMNGVAKVGVIIAGVTFGWPTGANAQASAAATAPARVAAAQQRADAARQRATELASAGGWA